MASRTEIIAEIEALEGHCRAPLMTTEVRMRWLTDWCSDLAAFDAEIVSAAFRDWRHSGNTKFPTPGQMLPMVRAKQPSRTGDAQRPRVWAPISDAEYDAMTLREKIRHQRILGQEARRRAGPMFRNTSGSVSRAAGNFVESDQMSPAWRKWSEIAAGHEAEAKRLSEVLRARLRDVGERAA